MTKDDYSYIKVSFNPHQKVLNRIREFVENFALCSSKKLVLAKATALAASELLDNAVKFSTGDLINMEVYLSPDTKNKEEIIVKVENYAHKKNIKRLQKILKKIKNMSPRDAYLLKLKKAMGRNIKSDISELGMARIQYEAYAQCAIEVQNKNFVTVSAKILNTTM